MITANRFWAVPAYLDHVHSPLTPDIIAAAETALQVRLPTSYLDQLRLQNGGYAEMVLPNSVQREIWGIGTKYPTITEGSIKQRFSGHEDEVWLPNEPHLMIPFAGDGHWYLCLDYRANGPRVEPRVTLVDLECESDEAVAGDFVQFMSLLTRDLGPNPIVVTERRSPEAVVDILRKALDVRFEGPDRFDHGYPIWRAKVQDGAPPDWLWVNPNEVPVGFRRHGKRDVNATREKTVRFPEHSPIATIVTCSPNVIDSIFDVMQGADLAPMMFHVPEPALS